MNKLKTYFTGRMNRKNFFFATLARLVLFYGVVMIIGLLPLSDSVLWEVILLDAFYILFWIAGISIAVRRGFDLNWSKALSYTMGIILSIPFVFSFILLLILLLWKGKDEPNRYGNPDKSDFFESVFGFKWAV